MIRMLLVVFLTGAAFGQQTQSLGDLARANRAKQAKQTEKDKSKDEQSAPPKKKVFTNDDVGSPPEPAASSTPGSEAKPERRFKPGLSLKQVSDIHSQIAFHRGMVTALEREAKPLRDKKNLTEDEQTKLYNLDLRIGWQKKSIADLEDRLYQ